MVLTAGMLNIYFPNPIIVETRAQIFGANLGDVLRLPYISQLDLHFVATCLMTHLPYPLHVEPLALTFGANPADSRRLPFTLQIDLRFYCNKPDDSSSLSSCRTTCVEFWRQFGR